eukprot:COSAG01_NODE_24062_length_791_cov_29.929191_2_plen_107_part_01
MDQVRPRYFRDATKHLRPEPEQQHSVLAQQVGVAAGPGTCIYRAESLSSAWDSLTFLFVSLCLGHAQPQAGLGERADRSRVILDLSGEMGRCGCGGRSWDRKNVDT